MHYAKSKRMNKQKENMQQDAELRATAMVHEPMQTCSLSRSNQNPSRLSNNFAFSPVGASLLA